MPTISKTQIIINSLILSAILLHTGINNAQSNIDLASKKNTTTYDEIATEENSKIKINYSKKSRTIWLEDRKKSFHLIVKKLKHNTNPEIVGADNLIRFTSRESYFHNGIRYFGITFAERSQQGDGSGQCGAGTEEYFIAYKQIDNSPKEIFRKLISSCKEGIELDYGDGNNNDFSVTSSKGEVTFRWLTFPGTDLYRIGRYNYLLNTITYEDIDRTTGSPIKN